MGYYADGSGSIDFSRTLKGEEADRLYELLCEVFGDVYIDDRRSIDHVDFYDGDKYYEDNVIRCLNRIAEEFPVESGCLEYAGEDHCFWRFVYDASAVDTQASSYWEEEEGWVEYAGDPSKVLVLEHKWSTEDNDGSSVAVFSARHRDKARKVMYDEAARVRREWRGLCGSDPWQPDYTWEEDDSIHLGFYNEGSPLPFATIYSWNIYEREVR